MKSKQTPWTHTGKTKQEITTEFGASGSRFKYTVSVPAGTACRKLDGGSDPWVVADLSFIEDKNGANSMLYHDANHYGIRISEAQITDIQPVR